MQDEYTRLRAKARRSRDNKRYGHRHQLIRAQLAPLVAAGVVDCARCHEPIEPGTPWDLGHDDVHPGQYSGPEHAACNRGAPNRNVTSRQW